MTEGHECGAQASDKEVREALVLLLSRMRPDWGTPDAIAKRVLFAEERLAVPLARVCADAVAAARRPDAAPDAFIAAPGSHPSDGRPADAETVAEVARRARKDIIGRRPPHRR